MNKKIVCILIFSMMLILSFSNIKSHSVEKNELLKEKDIKFNSNYFGLAKLEIGGTIGLAKTILNPASNTRYEKGSWYVELKVYFEMPHSTCKVIGNWTASASVGNLIIFDMSKSFEYINENQPDNIIETISFNIPESYKITCLIQCSYRYKIYEWNHRTEEWEFWNEPLGNHVSKSESVSFPKQIFSNIDISGLFHKLPNLYILLHLKMLNDI